jgi:hypothetical protein
MIKLIATDMDGTLLDDDKNIPENFSEVLAKLNEKKVCFVIASGRSFCSLKVPLADYVDSLTMICDNGAYIAEKGKAVKVSVMPHDAVVDMINFCEENKLTVLLCGKNGTWHNASNDKQHKEIGIYYNNQVKLNRLADFDDDIFKLAIFDSNGMEHGAYPKIAAKYGKDFNVQLSGQYWVDIMNKGVTKGDALRSIQNRLGINYEETMAFGDYLNDLELLENAYYSFAMQNSHELIKSTANFFTGSNNDNSVMKEIKKYVLD